MTIFKSLFFFLCFISGLASLASAQNAFFPDFTIHVHSMEPMRWASQSVSDDYYLVFRNDSVSVSLPYRGMVHRPMEETFVPRFKVPITNLKFRQTRKGRVLLSFRAIHQSDVYTFRIKMYPDRSVQIHLLPSHADGIRYQGTY